MPDHMLKQHRNTTQFCNTYIGNKSFYQSILQIAVPIMLQTGITNFVSLLDNIMVGQLGTEPMTGVSIVNELMYVFFLCTFGALSGADIFTAQYYGKGDDEGIRNAFRYKLWVGISLTAAAVLVFRSFGQELIGLYLHGEGASIGSTLQSGMRYLHIILYSFPAFMMVQIYAGTLRSCGEVKISLYAGLLAVAVNLILDYVLIFGKFGFPQLGVAGAAVATVAARYVECFAVVISSHCSAGKLTYIRGVYRTLKVPVKTVYELFVKGFPLFVNEALYSLGIVALFQSYSMRGIVTVAAINISFALEDIADILMIAMGDATAIIMGQLLGADMLDEAKAENKRILFLSAAVGLAAGILLFGAAFIFPNLYNTSGEIQRLARTFIMLQALFTIQNTLVNSIYYTLRAGGRSMITCLFDSVFLLAVNVPLAYGLILFTTLPSYLIFAAVNLVGIFKCLIGLILVRKGIWVRNIIAQ